MLFFVAQEAVNRTHQVGERLDVIGAQIGVPAEQRGKAHHLGVQVTRRAGHQRLEGIDHALEHAAAAVQAGRAERNQQTRRDEFPLIFLMVGGDRVGGETH